ncbi:rab escort protein 1 isoform X2 [Morus notabilis]|uniref:rab escort protein 1 isoform X2 n=1 Tax=Morus notabilis TaxID=981085 RepID=UPI000CECF78D|nr:rab escort protein 1 isoform X2 [Morus notabilis]XP_024021060.1 rab escort protein 1 isoform X2 [Morus notabilis]
MIDAIYRPWYHCRAAMSEASSYPPIEPNTFDLIIIGTGLPGSLIAATASAVGKTVLHLDPNPFYGSHFASLTIPELTSFLNSHSTASQPQSSTTTTNSNTSDYTILDLASSPLYADVEISSYAPETLSERSRSFNIDLGGPRVFFCADKAIDLIVKSGAGQYLEFKSIDASFVCDENGRLWNVPDSRAAIFKDKTLGLTEKNQLMRFFKLVQQHLEVSDHDNGNEGTQDSRISEEDLGSPFVEFLKKMRLPPKIQSIILYAIAMADYDQNNLEVCKDVLKTKGGIDRLALYNKSVGRFPNASGALIYPIYGHGELSQAFCRRAAVKGCLYVLRMPVLSLLMGKESGRYKGVRLASGQDLFSDQLVLDPTFTVPSPPDSLRKSVEGLNLRDVKGKVARGICVIASSLKPNMSNFLVVYPPRSLYPEQNTSIRAVQIGGGLAVCPSGMFVLYFSALCDDAERGKNLLRAAMSALLKIPDSENAESSSEVQNENAEVKPTLLWSATFIQELITGEFGYISSTPMPDGNLHYSDLLDATMKLFHEMYPDGEFFPETASPEDGEDEGELSLES